MTRTVRLVLALPIVFLVVSGCKNSTTPAKVYGKVTYNGAPVTAGSITFQLPEGGAFHYALKSDGTYSGSDLPTGEYAVIIETESANPNRKIPTYGRADKGAQAAGGSDYEKKMRDRGAMPESSGEKGNFVKIPAKYGDKAKSGLHANLGWGSNSVNFELTD
jgi:hypothetical protein